MLMLKEKSQIWFLFCYYWLKWDSGTEFLNSYFPFYLSTGGSVGKESACKSGEPDLIPGSGRAPGKGMATHSSILAWRIRWTKESRGLQPIGSQRIGHDWATNTHTHTHTYQKQVWVDHSKQYHLVFPFQTTSYFWFSNSWTFSFYR